MNITKIEAKKDCQTLSGGDPTRTLFPVVVTTKNFFGKEKKFDAYPTTYGPTYWSDSIRFFCFIDEYGKPLGDELSEQINNWIFNQRLKG